MLLRCINPFPYNEKMHLNAIIMSMSNVLNLYSAITQSP